MALPRRRDPQADQDWRSHYIIENPADVEAYVAEYPIVASVLTEAPAKIAATFEETPRLILRYEIDPDDEPASDYLAVDIMTGRDADDAHERLNRFDGEWWLDVIQHVARAGAVVVFQPHFA
jgi:hypothetical protein